MSATNGTSHTQSLTRLLSHRYQPAQSAGLSPGWGSTMSPLGAMGAWGLGYVDSMLADEQISLCLKYLQMPLAELLPEIVVESDDAEEQDFVTDTVRRFWSQGLPVAGFSRPYGRVGAEVVYVDEDGHKKFDFLSLLHPRDARPWTHEGQLAYVKLQGGSGGASSFGVGETPGGGGIILKSGRDSTPAKGTWWVYDGMFSRWYGRSVLAPCWWPWRAKTQPDASLESLIKWIYKWGVSPAVVRSPDMILDDEESGTTISGADYSIQIMTQVKAAGIVWMSSQRDDGGNYLYDIDQWQEVKGRAADLIEPVEFLNKMIQRGMGIPDEVLTFSGEGSQARASVSTSAFYLSRRQECRELLGQADRQLFRPLAKFNGFQGAYKVYLKEEEKPKPQGTMAPTGGGLDQGDGGQPQGDDPLAALLGGGGLAGGSSEPVAMSWAYAGEGPRGGKIWRSDTGAEYHGPNPPAGAEARTPHERKRQDVTRQARRHAIESAVKAGHVAVSVKDATAAVASRVGSAVWDTLPTGVQRGLAGSYRVMKAAEHVAMSGFSKTNEIAVEAARERGASEETAKTVGRVLSIIDVATAWTVAAPATYAATGSAAAAKVASWVPVASTAYIVYSGARNPWKTFTAARKALADSRPGEFLRHEGRAIADAFAGRTPEVAMSMTGGGSVAGDLADRIERHGDWYLALVSVAVDRAKGDVAQALAAADAAIETTPREPGDESVQMSASATDAAFYLSLREQVAALRAGLKITGERRADAGESP